MASKHLLYAISGSAGKQFVQELSKLYQACADASAMECIAFKAATILPILSLQRPHANSTAKEHVRLIAWRDGDINALVLEGRAFQRSHQKRSTNKDTDAKSARIFSRLMKQGKVKAALRVLSNNSSGRILPLEKQMDGTDSTVFDTLREKHSAAQDINREAVVPESALDQSRPWHPGAI